MPDDWTPDKPLADKETEEEVQAEARARARLKYLQDAHLAPTTQKKKKRRGVFSRGDED